MKEKFLLLICMAILLAACAPNRTARTSRRTPATALATATLMPWPTPSDTPAPTDFPTLTPTATIGIGSPVTLAQDAVCRMGPGESYYEVLPYFEKDALELSGRNETGDWVTVTDPFNAGDPACWIPSAALASTNGLDGLQVVDYPALPAVPTSINAPNRVCGLASQPLIIKWSPISSGSEYRLYRNGELVSTQSGGSYYDLDVPKPQRPVVYAYVLQTFNDYGNSPFTLSASVSVCAK